MALPSSVPAPPLLQSVFPLDTSKACMVVGTVSVEGEGGERGGISTAQVRSEQGFQRQRDGKG